jgi:EAL domain-containing protein (putative c-di-GMP-specific phosphodiesterase class I)
VASSLSVLSPAALTRRLSLVWQPVWSPHAVESRGELLTRVTLDDSGWTVSPLAWWRFAAALGPPYVAALDQWVWQQAQTLANRPAIRHINLWPQTVTEAARWIARQPVQGVVLEVTEQRPWPAAVWTRLQAVWIDRGGAVWLDDWTDPDRLPPLAGLSGVKLDRHIWDGMTPAQAARWARFVARCHERGLAVIAEGIETETQRDAALAWACDGLQGFLWGRPQPWPLGD